MVFHAQEKSGRTSRTESGITPMAYASPSTDVANAVYNAAQKFGIDPSWLFAIGNNESGLNANASVGGQGEIGTFQILPSTAVGLGYSLDPNATNYIGTLQNNADASAKYLSQLVSKFGSDPTQVFAAYNEGPTGLMHNGITGTVATYVQNALAGIQHYANNTPSPTVPVVPSAAPVVNAVGQIQIQNPDGSTTVIDPDGTSYTFGKPGGGASVAPSAIENSTDFTVGTNAGASAVKGVAGATSYVQSSISKATQNWLQQQIGGIEANIFLSGIALALIAGGITLIAQDHKQEIKVAVQGATKAALAS